MKHLLVAALSLLLACGGGAKASTTRAPAPPAPALSAEQQKLAEKLHAVVVRALEGKPMAGVSVAVVIDGKTILVRGYGMADVEARRPAAADTIYRIASITKTFTAAAIMKLVAEGKVGLDEPITRYLPDYDTHGAIITVRHLLTHTSGIKGYTEIPEFWPRSDKPFSRAEMVAMFEPLPLLFQPGERWSYSNSGYYLLGLIIEKVTGSSYAQVIRDLLAVPNGLADTGYCPQQMTGPRQARPYKLKDGKPAPADPLDMDHPYAAGSLCSTVTDLARWIGALAGHTAVTAEQWAQMTTPVKLADGSTFAYGLGMMRGDLDRHVKLGHNGGINGFHSKMEIFPADRLVIVALANTGGGLIDGLAEELARAALDLPAPKILDLPLDAAQAAAYQGRFDFPEVNIRLQIRYHEGKLQTANLDDDGKPGRWLPLRHQGNHVFEAPEVKARLTFIVEGGQTVTLQVEQGGLVLRGTPVR